MHRGAGVIVNRRDAICVRGVATLGTAVHQPWIFQSRFVDDVASIVDPKILEKGRLSKSHLDPVDEMDALRRSLEEQKREVQVKSVLDVSRRAARRRIPVLF